jgi:hypothetical protein
VQISGVTRYISEWKIFLITIVQKNKAHILNSISFVRKSYISLNIIIIIIIIIYLLQLGFHPVAVIIM